MGFSLGRSGFLHWLRQYTSQLEWTVSARTILVSYCLLQYAIAGSKTFDLGIWEALNQQGHRTHEINTSFAQSSNA